MPLPPRITFATAEPRVRMATVVRRQHDERVHPAGHATGSRARQRRRWATGSLGAGQRRCWANRGQATSTWARQRRLWATGSGARQLRWWANRGQAKGSGARQRRRRWRCSACGWRGWDSHRALGRLKQIVLVAVDEKPLRRHGSPGALCRNGGQATLLGPPDRRAGQTRRASEMTAADTGGHRPSRTTHTHGKAWVLQGQADAARVTSPASRQVTLQGQATATFCQATHPSAQGARRLTLAAGRHPQPPSAWRLHAGRHIPSRPALEHVGASA